MAISFRPLSYALGAEVIGVDLAKPVDDDQFAQIHKAFLDNGILLFRNQRISRLVSSTRSCVRSTILRWPTCTPCRSAIRRFMPSDNVS